MRAGRVSEVKLADHDPRMRVLVVYWNDGDGPTKFGTTNTGLRAGSAVLWDGHTLHEAAATDSWRMTR